MQKPERYNGFITRSQQYGDHLLTSFSDGVNLTTYRYDASGYRIAKTWSGGTAYFVMETGEYYNGTWMKIYVKVGGRKLKLRGYFRKRMSLSGFLRLLSD
jgi:YD repeat-containing protein